MSLIKMHSLHPNSKGTSSSSFGRKLSNETQQKLFLKYFPKYFKHFALSIKNSSIRSKLKRTKIIQEFQASYPFNHHRPYWRLFLANKQKTVKILSENAQSSHQFSQKVQLFSGLKSIKVSLPDPSDLSLKELQKEKRYLGRAFRQLRTLRNLQSLEIDNLVKNYKDLLERLNSHQRLLGSLTKFRLFCDWKGAVDPQLLQILQSKKNVLRAVTSLRLGALCSPSHYKSFLGLANACPKLSSLNFEFSCRNILYSFKKDRKFSCTCYSVDVNYLQAIETFQNLKFLNLDIADTFSFLQDLALPPSIQHLVLNFEECLSKEIMTHLNNEKDFHDDDLLTIFEQNKTLLRFYSSFQPLHHLETLKLLFSKDSNQQIYQFQSYLSHHILKRIPSPLKSLTSVLFSNCWRLNPSSQSSIKDLYLPQFVQSCENFSQTLEILELGGHEKIIYPQVDLSGSQCKFPKLSLIKITGTIDEENNIDSFLQEIMSLGNSIRLIKLNIFMKGTVVSLLGLLQHLNNVKKPDLVKTDIQVKLTNLTDLEDLGIDFAEVINELKSGERGFGKAKGVSLKVYTTVNSEYMKTFLKVYGEKFEAFEVRSKYSEFL